MSNWFEIANVIIQSAGVADLQTCRSEGGICPATAFNPIAAAFATQGYYMQADMLYFLVGTGFGAWAPFIYMIAAAGGIISLAMGMPPKMYVWFFVGPGIYHWLVETRAPASGVQWQVARVLQDQRQVWRMAHVGLLNSNITARMAGDIANEAQDTRYELQSQVQQTSWCKPAPSPVYVSNFFLWFDSLISYTAQRLVDITGITRTSETKVGTDGSQGALEYTPGTSTANNNWYLMSDKKWVLLDTITSARLNNADLRDAFATFLSSECGDALASAVDNTNFVIAANTKTGQMPCTVILHTNTADMRRDESSNSDCGERGSVGGAGSAFLEDKYYLLHKAMAKVEVPIPETFRRMFQDSAVGSYVYFLNSQTGGSASTGGPGDQVASFYRDQDAAQCDQLFYSLIQGFRWEAGQIYHQLIQSGPIGVDSANLLYNLFYGWGVRDSFGGTLLTAEEMKDWVVNLIFVHLIRNELALAPRIADKKFNNETALQTYAQNYVAQTGSKAKYGEVYSWARMVPYIQGVLLYLLALGYPFACIMIVMPGWHKTLFTWMSFWVWVKMWDVGFAVVSVMERSIWSMLGNSTKLNYVSPLINQMTDWGKMTLNTCATGTTGATAGASECFADMQATLSCRAVPDFADAASTTGGPVWYYIAALFDRGLMLGSSLDIDVTNGYYIYLMSALYFAVPAATGQLILGAKAGVAGMANSLMQGAQQDSGRGASSGFTGDIKNKGSQTAAAVGQSAAAKGYRASNMAARAFDASNSQLDAGLSGQEMSATNQNLGLQSQNLGLGTGTANAKVNEMGSVAAFRAAMAQNLAGKAGLGVFDKNSAPMSDPQGLSKTLGTAVSGSTSGGDSASASPETTGADKAGFGTRGMQLVRGAHGALNPLSQAFGQVYAMQTSAQQMAQSGLTADITSGSNASQAGMNGVQANNNARAFGQNTLSAGLGVTERRSGASADFGAQSSAYYARRGLSDSASGYTSSLGVDSGHLSVGNKPADMNGMASYGMLGGSVQSAYGYSSAGYMGARSAAQSRVDGTASSVMPQYGQATLSNKDFAGSADAKFRSVATQYNLVKQDKK